MTPFCEDVCAIREATEAPVSLVLSAFVSGDVLGNDVDGDEVKLSPPDQRYNLSFPLLESLYSFWFFLFLFLLELSVITTRPCCIPNLRSSNRFPSLSTVRERREDLIQRSPITAMSTLFL